MDTAWVVPAVLGASQVLIAYFTKKSSDDNRSEIRMLKNMQADTQVEQTRQAKLLKENHEGHSFRQSLYNAIIVRAAIKIIESDDVFECKELTDSLTSYFSGLPDFAQTFFYSDLRKNNKIPKEFLKGFIAINLNSEFSKLDSFIEQKILSEKSLLVGTNKSPVTFHEYLKCKLLKVPTIYDYNEILIERLANNGIDEKILIEVFVNYTDNFLTEFKKKWREFNKLPDFDVDIYCKM